MPACSFPGLCREQPAPGILLDPAAQTKPFTSLHPFLPVSPLFPIPQGGNRVWGWSWLRTPEVGGCSQSQGHPPVLPCGEPESREGGGAASRRTAAGCRGSCCVHEVCVQMQRGTRELKVRSCCRPLLKQAALATRCWQHILCCPRSLGCAWGAGSRTGSAGTAPRWKTWPGRAEFLPHGHIPTAAHEHCSGRSLTACGTLKEQRRWSWPRGVGQRSLHPFYSLFKHPNVSLSSQGVT